MNTFKFSGDSRSTAFLKDIKGVFVVKPGTEVADIKSVTGWQAVTMPATTAEIAGTYISLQRGYENQTDEAEMTTGNTGYTEKTNENAPRINGYAKMSYQDYMAWFAADQKEFDFFFHLKDNKIIHAPKTQAGQYKGFCGRIHMNFNLPVTGGEGKQQAHAFNIMLDSAEQFKNYEVVAPDFGMCEINDFCPLGFDIKVETPWAFSTTPGTVSIKATYRGTGEPFTELSAVEDFEVVSAESDASITISAVDDANASLGVYELSITEELTGNFELQALITESTKVTKLSNVITVKV